MSDDPSVWFALGIRFFLLALAFMNIGWTIAMYRHYHDVRALRSMVSAFALLGGVFMFVGVSSALREEYPEFLPFMRVISTSGLVMLMAGLIFIVSTWVRK